MDEKIKLYYENSHGKLFFGDVLDVLKTFEDESINCVTTSPPYYQLRRYNIVGEIGLEKTSQEYLEKLWIVFDEIKRVLRKDGSCFVNLGDTYSSSGGSGKDQTKHKQFGKVQKINKDSTGTVPHIEKNYPRKCLLQIPSRFSIGMVERGWTLRNEIIWKKDNVMPSSVKDRFTVDFEKIFFFVKNEKYYFEQQFEKYKGPMNRWGGDKLKALGKSMWDKGTGQTSYRDRNMRPNPEGKNMRSVWSINTKPLTEDHYSSYPPELVQRMVLAGCPEFVCAKCSEPRKIIYKTNSIGKTKKSGIGVDNEVGTKGRAGTSEIIEKIYTDCECNSGFDGGIVLDPFLGSGTTALVAQSLHRNWIGIDLSEKYCEIAKKRINKFTSFWGR